MENGVNKVEEVKSKVGELDKYVLGDMVNGNGIDDAFEETNGGIESVSNTVKVAETVDDGNDISDENVSLAVVEKLDDLVKAHMDSVKGPNKPPSPAPGRPAGLGPPLEPAHRVTQSQPNGTTSPPINQVIEGEPEENDDTRERLHKFLRLARRLGQTTHNVVVAQVLYRLGLAEHLRGRNSGRVAAFSFERASDMAEQLEATGQEPLEFSCTIMVLGKTGVGKSATINSTFDEIKFGTDPFRSNLEQKKFRMLLERD